VDFRHAVVSEATLAAEHEGVAGGEGDVAIGLAPVGCIAESEQAAVADAERDDGPVDDFVLVLMDAEARIVVVVVVVDQGRVGLVVGRRQLIGSR
jgi:hypothetical protein